MHALEFGFACAPDHSERREYDRFHGLERRARRLGRIERTMFDWGTLQIAVVTLTAFLTGLKLAMLLARRVNPFAVGLGKRGVARWVEVAAPLVVTVWLWIVLRYALRID